MLNSKLNEEGEQEYDCPNCNEEKPVFRAPCPNCDYEDKTLKNKQN